ncbi:MAG TPA: ROK family protein, partial [Silvibacterium sp.]|nr:ROK family protein [Silvibacterium sp.]
MAQEQAQSYTIGVDLGGTNLRIAAYTRDAGLLETILLPTRLAAGRDTVVDDLCGAVSELKNRFSSQHKLAGIGVGTPGPLELPAGRLHNPPNLPGWDGFDLRCELEKKLQQSVIVESDANLA